MAKKNNMSLMFPFGCCVDCEDSPYHLDVLDILTELQRQGYIRSIATKNVPSKILKSARRCGFAIDASQVEGNVLKPPLKSKEDKNVWLTSPLCGGFLSDKHMGKVVLPSMWEWSLSEQHQWRTTLYEWGDAQLSSQKGNNRKHRVVDHAWLWRRYQQDVLDPLVYISQKHCVSTASVALRWALQSDADDRVGSVVVASKMILDPRTGRPFDRHVRLREAFRFELDEEDMEQLKRIPNEKEPEPQLLLDEASFEEKYLEQGQWENMEEDYQKFLETQDRDYESRATIDFGNKSLWL
jgi:aryl-alcohol dehydrogenase-like predicted oxidoreductase